MPRPEDDCGLGPAKDAIVAFAAWLLENRELSVSQVVRELELFHQDAVRQTRELYEFQDDEP